MDLLTFLSKVIDAVVSLAWPGVALLLILLLRPHLGGLVRRVEEFSLPGGVKAKFGKVLEEAQAHVPISSQEESTFKDTDFLRLANELPEAAIIQSYREMEYILNQHPRMVGDERRPSDVIAFLHKEHLIESQTVELFNRVSEMRNAAVQVGGAQRLTPGEAIQYRLICQVLSAKLIQAFDRLAHRGKS
jgi:hypothetical protein